MKKCWRGLFPVFLAAAFLSASCVSRTVPVEETAVIPAAASPTTTAAVKTPEPLLPGNGLENAAFYGIPAEAKEYLAELSRAFRKQDRGFLVSQGEARYESELRGRLEEKIYLALLYRAGPYSEDSEWKQPRGAAAPVLDISGIKAIEYTAWEENGPLLKISGRFYFENGGSAPCTIMLVWRLTEPKILGEWP